MVGGARGARKVGFVARAAAFRVVDGVGDGGAGGGAHEGADEGFGAGVGGGGGEGGGGGGGVGGDEGGFAGGRGYRGGGGGGGGGGGVGLAHDELDRVAVEVFNSGVEARAVVAVVGGATGEAAGAQGGEVGVTHVQTVGGGEGDVGGRGGGVARLLAEEEVGFVDAEAHGGVAVAEVAVAERLQRGEVEGGGLRDVAHVEGEVGDGHDAVEKGEGVMEE